MALVNFTPIQDGTTGVAAQVNNPLNTIYNEFNGNINDANIKTAANINGNKILDSSLAGTKMDANFQSGWSTGVLPAPNTVTNNGNRSYDLVFNGTDITDTVSEGMRLRTTRTVSAPTQCADLESGSSQYFSKTSPAGISFTTTFTCSAWVKLESYTLGGIIARRNADTEGWSMRVNADGTIALNGLRIASNSKAVTSHQSIPLNKWVHVAISMDMTAGASTGGLVYIDGVLVPSVTSQVGTATTIVQGTTALVVGAEKSAGTNPFDGKIAQASVHSAVLSAAQIKAMMSQTIDSSSPSIVSGFTLNGVLTDVSANANDLTPQGSALATNVDSPFGSYLGGTLEYGIITKTAFSTDTTLTVQVPEGCTIPTSGGVSAVAYSTQSVPYLFPRNSGRWRISSFYIAQRTVSGSSTYASVGQLTIPIGTWTEGYTAMITGSGGSATTKAVLSTLSNTTTSFDLLFVAVTASNAITDVFCTHRTESPSSYNLQTTRYLNVRNGTNNFTNIILNGVADTSSEVFAIPAYL